jgi:peptidoglycan/xylan/chitin deacetylase (PgdA/CDA1 family)
MLITREEFIKDLKDNYAEMKKFGINKEDAKYFLPPYEWYNSEISKWCKELGITIVNFTREASASQDWTYPELGDSYQASESIYNRILQHEKDFTLNGSLLLIHIGADPRRTDKFYFKFDDLISELKKKGYEFTLLDETIN